MMTTSDTPAISQSARMLVVDDDPLALEMMTMVLEGMGHSVTTAEDGIAALDMLLRETFELALFDIDMPRMNGLELISTIRANQRFAGMPILVVSGRKDDEALNKAFGEGAVLFVRKPVNWELLKVQVEHALGLARLQTLGFVKR
jgi:CheY-like chemotaxis protein